MRRAVAAAVVAVLTLTAACTEQDTSGGGEGDRTFTGVDDHAIDPRAPINPFHQAGNSALGYNGMRLAWERNSVVDDPEAFYPGVAKSWEVTQDQSKVTVEIQPDATWSNGEPVTAEDIEVSAAVAFTQGVGAFTTEPDVSGGLAEVMVVDDKKVEFLQSPGGRNNTFARSVLTLDVVSKEAFGQQLPDDFWDTLRTATSKDSPARDQNAAQAELIALGRKLVAYGPERDISCGPFVLRTVDRGGAVLVKNEHFWNADRIDVDKVVLKNYGGNERIWRYQIGEKLDAAPYTATPSDVVKKILAKKHNKKVTGFSPVAASFAFDQSVEPFDDVHVRRGLAYAIDRELVTSTGNPESGTASKVTSGLVPTAAKAQIPDVFDELPTYSHDTAKAASELEQAGLTKRDGAWHLPDGRPWSFEIKVPAGFSDWLAGAKSISRQLKALGIDARASTVADYPTYLADLEAGRYSAGFWQIAQGPSNFDAYQRLYGASNGWMNGAETVEGVDPGQLTRDLSQQPVDEQKATVEQLARYTADQLPVIQIWDYTNVQFVSTRRFTGFPEDDSDVLRLPPGVWMQLGYVKAK